MYKATAILLALLVVLSCKKKNKNENLLTGKWHLGEILMDPGDGSGKFQKVDSKKTLTFFDDNTVKSNGTLCHPGKDAGIISTGQYTSATKEILPDNCKENISISVIKEEKQLILSYKFVCREACMEKYIKVK